MTYRRFVASQSIIMMAGSMVFPFYILLLRNVGNSFSQFGWAYGLFALTSALVYPLVGKVSDQVGIKIINHIRLVHGNLNALLSNCHGSLACVYSSNCNGRFRCCAA